MICLESLQASQLPYPTPSQELLPCSGAISSHQELLEQWLPLPKLCLPSWDITSPQIGTSQPKHVPLWATGEWVGCRAGGSRGQVAKGHPLVPQLCPHHVEVSLGVCLAKPEEHR